MMFCRFSLVGLFCFASCFGRSLFGFFQSHYGFCRSFTALSVSSPCIRLAFALHSPALADFVCFSLLFSLFGTSWRNIPASPTRSVESGDVLISRAVASQVPSALRGLTSVFGMGTGGSLSLLSPETFFRMLAAPSQLHRSS